MSFEPGDSCQVYVWGKGWVCGTVVKYLSKKRRNCIVRVDGKNCDFCSAPENIRPVSEALTVKDVVCGALYDFVGHLSCANEMTVGKATDPTELLEALDVWANKYKLSVCNPIKEWENQLDENLNKDK